MQFISYYLLYKNFHFRSKYTYLHIQNVIQKVAKYLSWVIFAQSWYLHIFVKINLFNSLWTVRRKLRFRFWLLIIVFQFHFHPSTKSGCGNLGTKDEAIHWLNPIEIFYQTFFFSSITYRKLLADNLHIMKLDHSFHILQNSDKKFSIKEQHMRRIWWKCCYFDEFYRIYR